MRGSADGDTGEQHCWEGRLGCGNVQKHRDNIITLPQVEGLDLGKKAEAGGSLGSSSQCVGHWPFRPPPPLPQVSLSFAVSLLNVSPPIFSSFCPLVSHNMQLVYINLNTKRKFYVLFGYILKWNILK